MQKRELVLLVDETEAVVVEAIDPLLQRNAINTALKTITNSAVVVANVRLTAKKNLVLTTTKDFSADFLLQYTDT
jgi:2-phospho-L-lactate guanylyltransferase (CobY/MobA/RfbA family)